MKYISIRIQLWNIGLWRTLSHSSCFYFKHLLMHNTKINIWIHCTIYANDIPFHIEFTTIENSRANAIARGISFELLQTFDLEIELKNVYEFIR